MLFCLVLFIHLTHPHRPSGSIVMKSLIEASHDDPFRVFSFSFLIRCLLNSYFTR